MVNRVINNPWYYPKKNGRFIIGFTTLRISEQLGSNFTFQFGRLLHVKLFEWTLKTPHWPKQHSWVPRHAQVNDHDMRDPQSAAAFHHGEVPNCSMTQPLGDHDPSASTASTAACELLPEDIVGANLLRGWECGGSDLFGVTDEFPEISAWLTHSLLPPCRNCALVANAGINLSFQGHAPGFSRHQGITASPGLFWDCRMMFWDLMSRWIMPLASMWVTADRTSATKCKHLPPGTGFCCKRFSVFARKAKPSSVLFMSHPFMMLFPITLWLWLTVRHGKLAHW